MSAAENRIKVLFLGGMSSIKGFPTAVECLPFLKENVVVQFGGNLGRINQENSLKERLIRWIKLKVYSRTYRHLFTIYKASNAEVIGLLKDPLPYIDTCDILITPFSVEHFSRPAVEAFAYGKPVIGSNVEGMDEIIDHGENGLLIEKDNPKALAEAINYLSNNPDVAREMGRKGRAKAEKLFSPAINTQKVTNIYRQVMQQKP